MQINTDSYINHSKIIDGNVKKNLLFINEYLKRVWRHDVVPITDRFTYYDAETFCRMEQYLEDLFRKNNAYPIKMILDDLRHTRPIAERNIEIYSARLGEKQYYESLKNVTR